MVQYHSQLYSMLQTIHISVSIYVCCPWIVQKSPRQYACVGISLQPTLGYMYHYNPHVYLHTNKICWFKIMTSVGSNQGVYVFGVAVKDMIMKAINRCSGCYATITDHNEKHCEHTYVPIFFFHMTLYKLSFLGNTNRSLCCP